MSVRNHNSPHRRAFPKMLAWVRVDCGRPVVLNEESIGRLKCRDVNLFCPIGVSIVDMRIGRLAHNEVYEPSYELLCVGRSMAWRHGSQGRQCQPLIYVSISDLKSNKRTR